MSVHNVVAYMNHGRWVADCPGPCYEGAVTVPGFACDECRELGHHIFVVPLLPLNATEIEEAMCLRPEARTRNWRSETVEELHRETRDYLWPKDSDGNLIEVERVAAAAKAAAQADRPHHPDGRLNLKGDWKPDDHPAHLGPPREPVRFRGRRLWIPPHLPEGWSEQGKPVGKKGTK